jgi:hypothetical protein
MVNISIFGPIILFALYAQDAIDAFHGITKFFGIK